MRDKEFDKFEIEGELSRSEDVSPATWMTIFFESEPAMFMAVQVYIPSTAESTLTQRLPFSLRDKRLSPRFTCPRRFEKMTIGVGSPL